MPKRDTKYEKYGKQVSVTKIPPKDPFEFINWEMPQEQPVYKTYAMLHMSAEKITKRGVLREHVSRVTRRVLHGDSYLKKK